MADHEKMLVVYLNDAIKHASNALYAHYSGDTEARLEQMPCASGALCMADSLLHHRHNLIHRRFGPITR